MERLSKKLKKTESEQLMNPVQHFEHLHQALNPTLLSASANGAAHFKSSSKQSNSGGGLISASSWRIGEAIVQKQLKQHLRQQKQHIKETAEAKADDFKPNEAKSSGPKRSESTNNAQNNHSPYSNRTKRTECHLVQETPSNRAATGHSKAVNTQGKQQQQQQQHRGALQTRNSRSSTGNNVARRSPLEIRPRLSLLLRMLQRFAHNDVSTIRNLNKPKTSPLKETRRRTSSTMSRTCPKCSC